ncbi:MAG: DUF4404 family protein [Limisphaerales bacterium]
MPSAGVIYDRNGLAGRRGSVSSLPTAAGSNHFPFGTNPLGWFTHLMLEDTLSKLEARIQNAGTLRDDNRAELIQLLGQLKAEVSTLSKTHEEQAQSIASFAELSTHEAMRESKNPETLKHSVAGLSSSVDELEKTHPQLVAVVNRIATTLSNMGI